MKKILAAIMSLVIILSMTACWNNKAQQIEPAPVDEPELELSVSDLDAMMKDCFGEGFIESKYEDGLYGVAVTADGMHYAVAVPELRPGGEDLLRGWRKVHPEGGIQEGSDLPGCGS